MISRWELLKRTGISAATLDSYVALNIVSGPLVRPSAGNATDVQPERYFADAALGRIEEVRALKSAGWPMAAIAARFAGAAPEIGEIIASQKLGLDDIAHPAYLLNRGFELTWCNELARKEVLGFGVPAPRSDARNIFLLLLDRFGEESIARRDSLLRLHLAFAKAQLSRLNMSGLLKNVEPRQAQLIARLYDDAAVVTGHSVAEIPYQPGGDSGAQHACKAYGIFVRDGVLIVHTLG